MLYLGWLLILIGLFIIISGVIALYRLPDFYTKLHGASIIECAGIPCCLLGLALMQGGIISAIKIIIMMILIFFLNPVSTHALGRASLIYKIDQDGRIK